MLKALLPWELNWVWAMYWLTRKIEGPYAARAWLFTKGIQGCWNTMSMRKRWRPLKRFASNCLKGIQGIGLSPRF